MNFHRILRAGAPTTRRRPPIWRFASGYGGNGNGNGGGHVGGGGSSKNPCNACYGRTLDDLPVPKGCWYADHERSQRMYTIWMALAGVYLAGSIVFAMRAFNFHAYPERHIVLKPEDFQ